MDSKKVKSGNLFTWVQLAASIFLFIVLFQMKMLPSKYILAAGIILLAVWILMFFLRKKNRIPVITSAVSIVLSVIFVVLAVLGNRYYDNTVTTLAVNSKIDYETNAISVIVLNDSGCETLDDLEGKIIGVNPNEDQENMANCISQIKEQAAAEYAEAGDFMELSDMLYDGRSDAILVNEAYRSMLEVNHEDFDYETKVIYQCEYQTEKEEEAVSEVDIRNGIFTVYISGIDTYGQVSTRSRSDVNMFLVVNMNTREILMVSIPRDYYVELGTIGQMDKLTHAGIYGINESIATVSNLFKTDINYYYRINFSSLINVVDVLGGVDVYSDRTFVPNGDRELVIEEGINHMDGRMALAYARERKVYGEGDNHRVQNQQDVLEAMIRKVFTVNTLMNYDNLLSSLEGSYETNMSPDEIMELMKVLLGDAANLGNWHIERTALTGTSDRTYVYSISTKTVYVMRPDQDSVDAAGVLINKMLEGESIR